MSRSLTTAVYAALLPVALAIQPASAATSATMVLDNIQLTAVDLNPNDGVNAQYWFRDTPTGNRQETSACAGVYNGLPSCKFVAQQTASLFTPALSSVEMTGAAGRAEVSANSLVAEASLSRPGLEVAVRSDAYSWNPLLDPHVYSLLVEAGTRLVVTADYSMRLQADNPYGLAGGQYARADATLYGHMNLVPPVGPTETVGKEISSFGAGPVSFSDTGTLTLNLDNPSSEPTTAFLGIFDSAWVRSIVPIPEPSTYALMIAGIVTLMGVTARRRRAAGSA